jgi:hypothetical protein
MNFTDILHKRLYGSKTDSLQAWNAAEIKPTVSPVKYLTDRRIWPLKIRSNGWKRVDRSVRYLPVYHPLANQTAQIQSRLRSDGWQKSSSLTRFKLQKQQLFTQIWKIRRKGRNFSCQNFEINPICTSGTLEARRPATTNNFHQFGQIFRKERNKP